MDNKKLELGRVGAVWLIAAIGVILSIILFMNIAPGAADEPTIGDLESEGSAVSTILNFTMLIFGLVLLLIVAFTLVSIVTNFQKQKKSLLSAGILIILVAIFYATGNSEIPRAVVDKGATEGDAIIASSGMSLTFLLLTVAVLLAAFMGIITKYVIKK